MTLQVITLAKKKKNGIRPQLYLKVGHALICPYIFNEQSQYASFFNLTFMKIISS